MSWEQRNADFCKAQTDAQMAYIEAEREVDRLKTENARLRELVAETLMDVHEYAEKYGIEPDYDAVNEHLDARMRELGVSE